jgi:double-stranded uracil-DNA glycosylase
MAQAAHRPTLNELQAARDRLLPDIVAPDLQVLFCGINPSLYSAALGQHFARPGNRFWPALAASGFTPRLLRPSEQEELLALGCGLSNLCPRPSAQAAELSREEVRAGAEALRRKVRVLRPRVVAVLGVGVYRAAFAAPKAVPGPQAACIDGSALWLLPNPSGLNAHYQLPALAEAFAELRAWLQAG